LISQKNFIIILISIVVVSMVILLNSTFENQDEFSQFSFDAVYLENEKSVLITFEDISGKSSFAVLEILGMETTFHEEFQIIDSKFSKSVPIEQLPKYGWKTTPVTLEITYENSLVKMKTEIHNEQESASEIIFGLED
tara:strand:+ start:1596 stop:2009 length:414 start_codon:yes stop_codon:yes gene_type:complete